MDCLKKLSDSLKKLSDYHYLWQTFLATAIIFLLFFLTFPIANKDIGKNAQKWTYNEKLLLSTIPVLLYLIFSGRILGVKGGTIEIQFTQVYQKNVFCKKKDVEIEYITAEAMTERRCDQSYLTNINKILQKKDKIPVLSIEINKKGYYKRDVLEEYLNTLIQYTSLRYVVFIEKELFRGYIDAKQLLYNLKGLTVEQDTETGQEYLKPDFKKGEKIIQEIEKGCVKNIQGTITQDISTSDSNKEALRKIEESKISELAVIDDQEKFVGFTNKETIAASVLNDLFK